MFAVQDYKKGKHMPVLKLVLDGVASWPDLQEIDAAGKLIQLPEDAAIGLCLLPQGMASGKSALAFRFQLPDGRTVIAETSLALFTSAMNAIYVRVPDEKIDVSLSPLQQAVLKVILDNPNATVGDVAAQFNLPALEVAQILDAIKDQLNK